ncbi:MAG: hypothetical protein Q7V12_03315, partial [Deltaproteobacteria bacterium]|nr:hypothetical protein [Deltaproteobacteria bacterium]
YTLDAVVKVFLGVKMTDEMESSLPFKIQDFVNAATSAVDLSLRIDNKPAISRQMSTRISSEGAGSSPWKTIP